MMIDFTKLEKLIPAKGSLTLSIQKLDTGELSMLVAPKFNEKDMPKHGKDEHKGDIARAVNPITFVDTAENFNKEFEQAVTEILEMKGQLLSATAAASKSVSAVSAKKKEELKKAIDKKKIPAAPAKPAEQAKGKETGDTTLNLFASAKKKSAEQQTAPAAGAATPEETAEVPGSEDNEELAEGPETGEEDGGPEEGAEEHSEVPEEAGVAAGATA